MNKLESFLCVLLISTSLVTQGCSNQKKQNKSMDNQQIVNEMAVTPIENFPEGKEVATFAGGCFWCTEAIFEEVIGVEKVVSGYAGGKRENPTYEQVCSGSTGHAEGIQITYDPSKVSYKTLLDVHMRTHNPTTLNRQGNDEGTQYRSVIFYHNDSQKEIAEAYILENTTSNTFGKKIVTEVLPLPKFYVAENYHQDYFALNANQPYCQAVVSKKVDQFESLFPELTKEKYK